MERKTLQFRGTLEEAVLETVSEMKVANYNQISKKLNVSPYSVSDVMKFLEKRGLVFISNRSVGSPNMVILTEQGKEFIDKMRKENE